MNDVDASMRELERAMGALNARGIQICSNVQGKALDLPAFQPIFAAMAAHDLPIWLHPYRSADIADYPTEERSLYEIWWTLGWPYESSVAMSRLVFSGIFDRYPNLKIITHHMGGMIPYFEGRVGPGWDQLGSRTSDRDYTKLLKELKKRPLDYFKMFYADTATFGAYDPTVCGLRFFGVDNVLFASDAPVRSGRRTAVHSRDDQGDRSPSHHRGGARADLLAQRRSSAEARLTFRAIVKPRTAIVICMMLWTGLTAGGQDSVCPNTRPNRTTASSGSRRSSSTSRRGRRSAAARGLVGPQHAVAGLDGRRRDRQPGPRTGHPRLLHADRA